MTSSPLLGLPAELRNNIYRLVLTSEEPVEVTAFDIRYRAALLDTCKQIQSEATEIFYKEKHFVIPMDCYNAISAAAWLQSLEDKVAMISKLSICVRISRKGNDSIAARLPDAYNVAKSSGKRDASIVFEALVDARDKHGGLKLGEIELWKREVQHSWSTAYLRGVLDEFHVQGISHSGDSDA